MQRALGVLVIMVLQVEMGLAVGLVVADLVQLIPLQVVLARRALALAVVARVVALYRARQAELPWAMEVQVARRHSQEGGRMLIRAAVLVTLAA